MFTALMFVGKMENIIPLFFDGPIFNEAVPFETGVVIEDGDCCFLQLK
jgi:hypothetical protein